MTTYKLTVTGRVHSVNYCQFVEEVAHALGYVGYVRNLTQESVEVVVNAPYEEDLEFFISKLYEGSFFSDVHNVTYTKINALYFDHFEKR